MSKLEQKRVDGPELKVSLVDEFIADLTNEMGNRYPNPNAAMEALDMIRENLHERSLQQLNEAYEYAFKNGFDAIHGTIVRNEFEDVFRKRLVELMCGKLSSIYIGMRSVLDAEQYDRFLNLNTGTLNNLLEEQEARTRMEAEQPKMSSN